MSVAFDRSGKANLGRNPTLEGGPVLPRGIAPVGVFLLPTLLACGPSPAMPSAAAPPPSPFATLARGYYTLTVDIDDSCNAFPTSLKQRRYDVVIEDPGWHFLLVRVVGSGFSMSPTIGELWVRDDPRGFRWPTRLRWNEFEDEAYPEILPDSRQLLLSADGEMAIAESIISGTLAGTAVIRGSGSNVRCSGAHRFTFVRPK